MKEVITWWENTNLKCRISQEPDSLWNIDFYNAAENKDILTIQNGAISDISKRVYEVLGSEICYADDGKVKKIGNTDIKWNKGCIIAIGAKISMDNPYQPVKSTDKPEFYYNIQYKEGNKILDVFKRFPELIPAVGGQYYREDGKGRLVHRKMLLVGESNYIIKNEVSSDDSSRFCNPERWYFEDKIGRLIPEGLRKSFSNWEAGEGHPTFGNVASTLKELLKEYGIQPAVWMGDEYAFYNYYLRPAIASKNDYSFHPDKSSKIDDKIAAIALKGIISELQPDYILFLSDMAYKSFTKMVGQEYEYYDRIEKDIHQHPNSAKYKGKYEYQQYLSRIKEAARRGWLTVD